MAYAENFKPKEACLFLLDQVAKIASDHKLSIPDLLEKSGLILKSSLKEEVLK